MTARQALLLSASCILLVACSVGPDFHAPAVQQVSSYLPVGEKASATSGGVVHQSIVYGAPVSQDWYLLFHNNMLSALIDTALENNGNLQAALASLRAASADRDAMAGREWPSLEAGSNAGRTRYNGSYFYQPPAFQQGTANRYALTANLSYNLDVFGGTRRAIEASDAGVDYARAYAADAYATLVNAVVETSFAIAADRARVAATESLIDVERRQVLLISAQKKAGTVAEDVLLSAQAQLEATERMLPALRQAEETASNQLTALLGATPDLFVGKVPALSDFTLPGSLPAGLPSELVAQRPDISMAENSLHKANAEIGVAEAARLPSLTLNAQYGAQSIKTSNLFSDAANIWSVAGNLATPILEGGALAANARAARARRDQAAALYRQTVLNAFAEVASALQAVSNDEATAAIAARELTTAAAARKLAESRLAAGASDAVSLLIAEGQYQKALLGDVDANAQRFVDTAKLMRALGGGWQDKAIMVHEQHKPTNLE